MGGYAPHFSFYGIFKSSIKTTHLPNFGPYIPFLLLSNLPSTISYVYVHDVYAENPNSIVIYLLVSNFVFSTFFM